MTDATLDTETEHTAATGTAADSAVDSEASPEVSPDLDPETHPEAENQDEAEDGQTTEAEEGSDLQLAGGSLTEEELAAVTALLGTLAGAAETQDTGAGSTGPKDRTLQRRRRLGLWGRPGPDSWRHAAGLR